MWNYPWAGVSYIGWRESSFSSAHKIRKHGELLRSWKAGSWGTMLKEEVLGPSECYSSSTNPRTLKISSDWILLILLGWTLSFYISKWGINRSVFLTNINTSMLKKVPIFSHPLPYIYSPGMEANNFKLWGFPFLSCKWYLVGRGWSGYWKLSRGRIEDSGVFLRL